MGNGESGPLLLRYAIPRSCACILYSQCSFFVQPTLAFHLAVGGDNAGGGTPKKKTGCMYKSTEPRQNRTRRQSICALSSGTTSGSSTRTRFRNDGVLGRARILNMIEPGGTCRGRSIKRKSTGADDTVHDQ